MNAKYIKECIHSHMNMDDSNPWSFTNLVRQYPHADAKFVLQRCGLDRIAKQLCDHFNLHEVMDLCKLTDDAIDRITWLVEDIPKAKLKKYCEICRQQRSIQTTTARVAHTSTGTVPNSDLRRLLESLNDLGSQDLGIALESAPIWYSKRGHATNTSVYACT